MCSLCIPSLDKYLPNMRGWPENTHLPCKGKYHCAAVLLFYLFEFSSFDIVKLPTDLATYLFGWTLSSKSGGQPYIDTSPIQNIIGLDCFQHFLSQARLSWTKKGLKGFFEKAFSKIFDLRAKINFHLLAKMQFFKNCFLPEKVLKNLGQWPSL